VVFVSKAILLVIVNSAGCNRSSASAACGQQKGKEATDQAGTAADARQVEGGGTQVFQRIGSTWRSRSYVRSIPDPIGMTVLALVLGILVLVAAFVRWRVIKRDHARITLADGRCIRAPLGSNLFRVLKDAGVEIPSTCGGQGSCAQCRCRILRGGGRITEQERPYFSQAEIRPRWRLACQVVVAGDMALEVPEPLRQTSTGGS